MATGFSFAHMFSGYVHHFSALHEYQVRENRKESFVPIFQVAPRQLSTNINNNLYHFPLSYFKEVIGTSYSRISYNQYQYLILSPNMIAEATHHTANV